MTRHFLQCVRRLFELRICDTGFHRHYHLNCRKSHLAIHDKPLGYFHRHDVDTKKPLCVEFHLTLCPFWFSNRNQSLKHLRGISYQQKLKQQSYKLRAVVCSFSLFLPVRAARRSDNAGIGRNGHRQRIDVEFQQ